MKNEFYRQIKFDPFKPLRVDYGIYPHQKTGIDQVVNRTSADAINAMLVDAQKNGAPGLPVYVGHPDSADQATAARYPDKAAHGWLVACTIDEGGFDLQPQWIDEPKAGQWIYFSPRFRGTDAGNNATLIDEMPSVGLTNNPNTRKFTLPNEAETGDVASTVNNANGEAALQGKSKGPTMEKILAELGLALTATEDEAVAAIQAIKVECEDCKRQLADKQTEIETSNAACGTAKKELNNERDARIDLLLDCGMRDGRVTPATKPNWKARLQQDFDNEAQALGRIQQTIKTKSELDNEKGGADVLTRYEAMQPGADKAKFLKDNAAAIHKARTALGQ
jgi:hypothetical protein